MSPLYAADSSSEEDIFLSARNDKYYRSLPLGGAPLTPPDDKQMACGVHTSFDGLVEDIRRILGPSSGIDSDDIDVHELMATLREFDSVATESQWSQYALRDPSRNYTRNGVDDINKKANLLILVWNPGKGSMIHDHANAHCIVKMLKGTLTETLYDWPKTTNGQLEPIKVTNLECGQVSYMADTLGLHRMSNPHPTDVAISLHLYTPPYAAKFGCHIFDEKSGESHKVDLSTLYSNKGVVCRAKADCC